MNHALPFCLPLRPFGAAEPVLNIRCNLCFVTIMLESVMQQQAILPSGTAARLG